MIDILFRDEVFNSSCAVRPGKRPEHRHLCSIPILEGTFAFDSSDKNGAWTTFATGYNKLLDAGDVPTCLSVQPTGVAIPGVGNVFSVSATWASDDHDEGRKWMDKIATLGACVMNVVKATTWHAHCEEHEKMIVSGVYGRARTLNFRSLTSKTVEILAKYNDTIPGPGSLFSAQLHHDPIPPEKSVFAPRSDHYWLEIVATSLDEASRKAGRRLGSCLEARAA
ncbi:hypothetical protein NW754_000319 [Fusarium falciforme]|nr:hypothetical protein NW754_000319 [Fusarium falciforme]